MKIDRAAIIAEALEALDVGIWRRTRYANDTGTCLWCSTGSLVMVPDDEELEWYCQAEGSTELSPRLAAEAGPRLEAAARAAAEIAASAAAWRSELSPAQQALLAASEDLRREGFDEGLSRARIMFAELMRSKFGPLPPMVEARIATADFHQLERWAGRLFTLPRAILVVA